MGARGRGGPAAVLALLISWIGAAVAVAQLTPPPQDSCYSGVARLKLMGENDCQKRSALTRFLTAPMNFGTDLPWDCLQELLVSVEGCKISVVPAVNSSSILPGFACNWLEYQGFVTGADTARLALWTRPVSTARWVLYNTNLTSWRAKGVSTISFGDLEAAINKALEKDPNLPASMLMRQPEIAALQADSVNFAQQFLGNVAAGSETGAAGKAAKDTAAGGTSGRRLMEESPPPPPPAGGQGGGEGKPPLPPGMQADVGNGLVTDPIAWQAALADLYSSNGSPMFGFADNATVVIYNNERCNLTYAVMQGGVLGAGAIDRATVGMNYAPAVEPFLPPYVLNVDHSVSAQQAGGAAGAFGGARGATTTAVVILSVLGAALLVSLAYLGVRLARAPRAAAAAAAGAGAAPAGCADLPVERLEQTARAHGAHGGI